MTKEQQFVLELRRLEAKYGLWLETSEWLNLQDAPPKHPDREGSLSVLDAKEQAEVLAAESVAPTCKGYAGGEPCNGEWCCADR